MLTVGKDLVLSFLSFVSFYWLPESYKCASSLQEKVYRLGGTRSTVLSLPLPLALTFSALSSMIIPELFGGDGGMSEM